jgi:predicted transposase YbfD/YdcC
MEYIDEHAETNFADVGARQYQTEETGHGRHETRAYVQMPVPETLRGREQWKGLKTIGMVVSIGVRNGKETMEARYYISSLPMGVKLFARAVRSHWGIENSCHWSLDVTYREDESRIREKHLRENFAWLNRLTLSLLKQHPGRDSTVMKRRACGWNENFLLEVLAGAAL